MTSQPALPQRRNSRLRRFWRHPLWAPLNNREAWGRLAAAINPLWSLSEARARVVQVIDEAPGVKSLWLRPNGRFAGFRPGQHVLLELDIDGARHARCFSFSQAPRADGLLRLTIKAKQDGPVSTAAHALIPGQVVRLSQAQGSFPPQKSSLSGTSDKLLMLSAGSGVTPMLSLLTAMADEGSPREVVMLHSGRSQEDILFSAELRQLAARWPRLQVHLHATQASGRLDARQIARYVPDWAERETLLCGPHGFMETVEAMYARAGRSDRLLSESFGRRAAPIDPDAAEHEVAYGDAKQVFTAKVGQSLLDAAEAAGLQPRFGCRRGICRTCQCLKRSGTVTNVLTGQVSDPGEQLIQLCISTAQSAVELAL